MFSNINLSGLLLFLRCKWVFYRPVQGQDRKVESDRKNLCTFFHNLLCHRILIWMFEVFVLLKFTTWHCFFLKFWYKEVWGIHLQISNFLHLVHQNIKSRSIWYWQWKKDVLTFKSKKYITLMTSMYRLHSNKNRKIFNSLYILKGNRPSK